jgi:hypothetical protein
MARISEQVLAGLARPQMAQGMFDLGAAIGRVPGQMKQKRRQDEFNEIMKMGQAAMTQNDPVNLSRVAQQLASLGYTKESQQFAQAAQQANLRMQQRERVGGLLTQAGSEEGLTREAVQSFVGAGGNLANIPIVRELEKQYDEPLREKGRGRLRAMAQMELFDPQDPGKLQGYKNVAERHKVSFNEAMQILAEERGTSIDRFKASRTGAGGGKATFFGGGKYKDNRGLEYRITEIRNPDGTLSDEYQPVGHEIPYAFSYEDPETGATIRNRLTEKGGAYGETAGERLGRYGEEQEIKKNADITKAATIKEGDNFSDMRAAGAQRLPVVEDTLRDVNDLLEVVKVIDQGGSLVPLMNNIDRILGYEEKNPGKLRIVAKEILVGRIKSFGANPTEGERQYLEQLIPLLENSKEVNIDILERLQERLGREKAAIGYMFSDGADLDGYVNYVDALYSADTGPAAAPTGNVVVDINDIP